jgi:hypothetical protein
MGDQTDIGRDLLGLAEAAALLRVSKAVLCERRSRSFRPGDRLPAFPVPLVQLQCGPIWSRAELVAYRAEAKRRARRSWYSRYTRDVEEHT